MGNAGSGLPLPRLRQLFGVEFCLDFRVRHSNQSPHEVCELAEIARGILCGSLGVIRHCSVPFGAHDFSVPEVAPECNDGKITILLGGMMGFV